jgi:hypothetical protein
MRLIFIIVTLLLPFLFIGLALIGYKGILDKCCGWVFEYVWEGKTTFVYVHVWRVGERKRQAR